MRGTIPKSVSHHCLNLRRFPIFSLVSSTLFVLALFVCVSFSISLSRLTALQSLSVFPYHLSGSTVCLFLSPCLKFVFYHNSFSVSLNDLSLTIYLFSIAASVTLHIFTFFLCHRCYYLFPFLTRQSFFVLLLPLVSFLSVTFKFLWSDNVFIH